MIRSLTIASTALAVAVAIGCSRDRAGAQAQGPYAKQVDEAIPMIEKATGLRYKKPPVLQRRTRDQVHAFLVKQLDDERTRRDLAAQQVLLTRLGLIPDTLDLRKFELDLLTEQVAGFYDPVTKVLYVVDGAPREMVDFTIQHELVHALQDQYMNLDSLQHIEGDDDRALAAQAVLEGQAMVVPLKAILGPSMNLPGGWDRVRDALRDGQSKAFPKFSAAPPVLQETLLFPYLSGADFMHRFEEHDPGQVPYGSRLPVSTEQVMHDAAYFGNPPDLPTHVTLPAPTGATSTYDNDVGEFETRLFLYQHLKDQPLAVRAAAGWDGDRYAVLKTAHGDGIVWVSVWDTPFDAAEFSDALGQVMAKRYPNATPQTIAGGKRWTTSGRTISVWGGEIAGRPAVMYVDVPVGANPSPIDPAKVTLK